MGGGFSEPPDTRRVAGGVRAGKNEQHWSIQA